MASQSQKQESERRKRIIITASSIQPASGDYATETMLKVQVMTASLIQIMLFVQRQEPVSFQTWNILQNLPAVFLFWFLRLHA